MTIRIGVDTGGTFTDVVLYNEKNKEIYTTKTPSTPASFEQGVITGIRKILSETETNPESVSFLSHGSTVGTNAVLEGELPTMGLITNEGFRDVVEIGDQTRPDVYDFNTEKPPALIPRYLRKEVPGRVDANGNVIKSLDENSVRQAVEELASEDVESIVVSELFSFLYDDHEQRIGEIIEEHEIDVSYALTSVVRPEVREYNRTITTIINEGIKTTLEDYLGTLESEIQSIGVESPLNIMHSGGGIFGPEQAIREAIRTIVSGPAAGAVAAQHISDREGYSHAIGMDMGGTSADVSIIRNGTIARTTEGEINDLPINTPMVDINTIGAGGGSIAWIDEGGVLRVGPKSAGADPGPICYGEGGERPTVTDANLLLGRLNPQRIVGGEMELAINRTRELFRETISDPLNQSVEEAALSVIRVANARLTRNLRKVTIERGNDPSNFVLVPFGGAGPLQAPDVARNMDMQAVLIPKSPGVFSARGLLMTDMRQDLAHAYRSKEVNADQIETQFTELENKLIERFKKQGISEDRVSLNRSADLRYEGQSYELTVPVTDLESVNQQAVKETIDNFFEKHERLYGHAAVDEPVEFVTLRVTGSVSMPTLESHVKISGSEAHQGKREIYFKDVGFIDADIYERGALGINETVTGPAIIEESTSTSIVPPDYNATVTKHGNLIVEL